jgi:hypothetical protein
MAGSVVFGKNMKNWQAEVWQLSATMMLYNDNDDADDDDDN